MTGVNEKRRAILREERLAVAGYRDRFEPRIIATFTLQGAAYAGVILLAINGTIPLWLGLIGNTVLASMFYMPLHEAAHGNIWGAASPARWGEDLVGMLSSIPTSMSYKAHRISHMKHHAFTNDPVRDPDHITSGPLRELPGKWLMIVIIRILLPLFAFVPASQRLIPKRLSARIANSEGESQAEGVYLLRFWLIMHVALLGFFLGGLGLEAIMLWYIPSWLQLLWLAFVFAWFPHHPATDMGRYVDTRVAVFPGSTLLVRGHDHHALHHLFPRVPHFRLPGLWQEIGPQMTERGVRTQGRALGATDPIVW